MKKIILLLLSFGFIIAGEFKPWGHIGVSGQWNVSKDTQDSYAGASASAGFDVIFENGISFGLGGAVAYPIYKQLNYGLKKPYGEIGVISDAYFAYSSEIFQLALGRYDTTNIKYAWFSGNNEGISLTYKPFDFMRMWGLYSFEQTMQFKKNNRETHGQMNALWNYKRHSSNIDSKRDEHLAAFGLDFYAEKIFTFSPYLYAVSNNFIASGFSTNLFFGDNDGLFSKTTLDYAYLGTIRGQRKNGHLIWIDQEFGYKWFSVGGGYYRSLKDGVSTLTNYGDKSRFYGSVITPSYQNASGTYFGANQSTYYAFINARHDMFNIDILYAGGGYSEISALASVILFKHLSFGGGFVRLDNKQNYLISFVKAIW